MRLQLKREREELTRRASGTEMAFLIAGAIVGTVLALRFKVLVLVPAIALATAVIIANGSGHKPSVIILTVVGTAASLQIGYLGGCILGALASEYLPGRTVLR